MTEKEAVMTTGDLLAVGDDRLKHGRVAEAVAKTCLLRTLMQTLMSISKR